MNDLKPPKTSPYFGLFAALALGAALLIPGIHRFGMWEPHETDRANLADTLAEKTAQPTPVPPGGHLEERIVAVSWALLGKSELSARLPLAMIGLIALAGLYILILPLGGARIATYAALALVFSPIFLFHSRQLTSGVPVLLGEILAIGGFVSAGMAPGARAFWIRIAVATVGLGIGTLETGVLMGAAFPCATVALALALNGRATRALGPADEREQSSFTVLLLSGTLAVLAIAAFVIIALFSEDVVVITGGLAIDPPQQISFDAALEQLLYGWFPLSSLIAVFFAGILTRQGSDKDGKSALLTHLAIAGIAVGTVAQTFFLAYHGTAPLMLAVPMSLAVALAIGDLETQKVPVPLAAIVAITALAIMIKDFALEPQELLTGYGFGKIEISEDVTPIPGVALAIIPLALFVLFTGFTRSDEAPLGKWRSRLFLPFFITTGACFGGYLSFVLVPNLSVHLSSKYAMESYKQFKKGDEPLGVFGAGHFLKNAQPLKTRETLLAWLERPDRVFALFPPSDLADLNNRARKKHGQHLFILDAESERFVLATSAPHSTEKNANPIAPHVQSHPFKLDPSNTIHVNFDHKISLLGWQIRGGEQAGPPHLTRGKKATIKTYWRCDAPIHGDYDIFIHIDGTGGRIHGDHTPLKGIYPTSKWVAGDHIEDVHHLSVPVYQKKGTYQVRIGLYRGKARMRVVDYPNALENAINLAKLEIR